MPAQFAPANLDILRRTTRADFLAQLQAAQNASLYTQVAMNVDSDSDQEVYAFFGTIPKPNRTDRAGGGGRTEEHRALNDFGMTVVNATWKMVVPFHRDILEDAKLNMIKVRAQQQADSATLFLDEHMSQVIENNANSYDQIAFFGSGHDGGTGNAHINDLTNDIVTPAAPTIAEFEDSFRQALARLRILQDDQNRIANSGGLGLVTMVAPNHEYTARAILEVGPVAGQTGNAGVFKNLAKVLVNPFLTTTDRFYLFATSSPVKPLLYQLREPWEFNLITEGDDWHKEDLGHMISRSRFEFSGADHKKAVRMVLT